MEQKGKCIIIVMIGGSNDRWYVKDRKRFN